MSNTSVTPYMAPGFRQMPLEGSLQTVNIGDPAAKAAKARKRRGRHGGQIMPQGDKSSYTNKQKRQARHIEERYEHRGLSTKTAEKRAWATVNKLSGGGRKSGSGKKDASAR
jgi:hypothetical protein